MAAARFDLVGEYAIEQGATFQMEITVDGVDLSGYSARMQGRLTHPTATTIFSLTTGGGGLVITGGTDSVISITIAAATTTAFTAPLEGVWDIEYVDASGTVVTRAVEGLFVVTPEVTR